MSLRLVYFFFKYFFYFILLHYDCSTELSNTLCIIGTHTLSLLSYQCTLYKFFFWSVIHRYEPSVPLLPLFLCKKKILQRFTHTLFFFLRFFFTYMRFFFSFFYYLRNFSPRCLVATINTVRVNDTTFL